MVQGLYEEKSREARWEALKGYLTTLQARDGDGALVTDGAAETLLTPDGPMKLNGWFEWRCCRFRARAGDSAVFADG